jgi:hypothetical protein
VVVKLESVEKADPPGPKPPGDENTH